MTVSEHELFIHRLKIMEREEQAIIQTIKIKKGQLERVRKAIEQHLHEKETPTGQAPPVPIKDSSGGVTGVSN